MNRLISAGLLVILASCGSGSEGSESAPDLVTRQQLTRACLNTSFPGPDPTPAICECLIDYINELRIDEQGRQDVLDLWLDQRGKAFAGQVLPGTIRAERLFADHRVSSCQRQGR